MKQKLVKKTDGTIPSVGAISTAARDYKDQKNKRGRKKGQKSTTRAEDKLILKAFKKMRPPGSKGKLERETEREGREEEERER